MTNSVVNYLDDSRKLRLFQHEKFVFHTLYPKAAKGVFANVFNHLGILVNL